MYFKIGLGSDESQAGRRASSDSGGQTRHQLAIIIIALSIIGISVFAGLAIWLASSGSDRADTTRLVFSSVLPLFGTWVGTVLAFYFARENLQTATASTLALTGRAQPDTPVQQVMIPKSQILSYDLTGGEDVMAIRLKVLRDRMTAKGLQRIPILNQSGAVVYVIHQSTIDSFASSVNKNPQDDQAFTETMAALLSDPTYEAAAEAIGVVGPNAVLAEARTAMRSVPGCNDVFVTTSGRRMDPVLGWLTNTDMAENK